MVGQDHQGGIVSIVEFPKASDDAYAFGNLDQSLRAPFVGRLNRAPCVRGIEVWVIIGMVHRTPPFCLPIMPELRKC